MEQLKLRGFKVRPNRQSRPLADDSQSRKIRSLWLEMHQQGIVNDPSERALGGKDGVDYAGERGSVNWPASHSCT
ncbi:regulatory protein GemA [Pseudomonas aeruginosa]|uniref:regulatory protein GemA n=1 Tax=Pseudomonas aeruginosa TaxID=287 RepID=UPI0021ABF383|nr:regulatory protein GemA [Pseudomonas aeruginosa]